MSHGRLPACLIAFCGVVLAAIGSQAQEPSTSAAVSRPNIIFILLDDQGWGDAGAFGHPYLQTPSIDRLAREGSRFTQFYVANPVCSPSRTAFMTGQYPARHSVHEHFATHKKNAARRMPDWLNPDTTTICDLLKGAGYATAHFGKWHLGSGNGAPTPSDYGVDDHRTVHSSGPGWPKLEPDPYPHARSTELFVDEAIRFIKANRATPFYVNLWTLVPHALLNPTPEELAEYGDLYADAANFPSWMHQYVRDAKKPAQQMRIYCAAMTGLDQALGRLLDFLDKEGLAENTIIVISSDNGPEDYHIGAAKNAGMGSPGVFRGRKRSLYEGGIRTPLVVRWPGRVAAGRVDDTSVLTAVDYLPTICRLAKVEVPELQLDGEDVGDIWLDSSRPRTRPIFWEWRGNVIGNRDYFPPRLAVRQGDWKFLCEHDGSGAELYNIPLDPEERSNLADAHAEVVAELRDKVLEWQKSLPASGPMPRSDLRKLEQ